MRQYLKRLNGSLRGVAGQSWLWLVLWTGALLLIHHPHQSLMAYDEGYYAQQARWILDNQDGVTVGWWGQPVFDRTIGANWLIALSYLVFDRSEWSARLPSMVFSLGAVVLTWQIGQRLWPPSTGLWGAAIFTVMPLWMHSSKLATQDVPLVFLELLAIWGLLQAEDHPRRRGWWGGLAGVALGLGFLMKSVMIFLPIVALLPYLVWGRKSHRHLQNPGLYLGLALGIVPTAFWLGASSARYGWLPFQHLFGKLLFLAQEWNQSPVPTFNPAASMTYYLWHIPATTFPWMLFALVGAGLVWRNPSMGRRTLWLGYPVVLFILLSLFNTRTWYYSLQLYPLVALLAAVGLQYLGRWYRSRAPHRYRVAVGLSWAIGVLGLLLASAGVAVLLAPGALFTPELRAYGWLGMAGGVGWLLPWGLAVGRRSPVSQSQQRVWQWSWLLGPWLLIAATFATGLWGNYNPALKASLATEPTASVLAQNAVYFLQPSGDRDTILLTFYSPNLGVAISDWADLPPGEYAWGNGQRFPVPTEQGYDIIATVGTWHLVKAPLAPINPQAPQPPEEETPTLP